VSTFLFGQRAMITIHKDLLNLVFLELEYGHDMFNFSEINRRCNQIFYQHITIVKTISPIAGKKVIYTVAKLMNLTHGIYRKWDLDGQLIYECHRFHGKWHGVRRQWFSNHQLWYEQNWYHARQHGISRYWRLNGKLSGEEKWHYGRQIE